MSGVGVRGLVGPVASATLLSLLIASSSGATVVTTSSVSETSVTTQGGLTSSIGCQRRRLGTDPQPDRRREDRQAAGSILRTLADHYTAPTGQAVLDGSVSTYGVDPPDIGTSYGDYYYLHAIEARFNRG